VLHYVDVNPYIRKVMIWVFKISQSVLLVQVVSPKCI